jgi:hypothetical protein
MLKSGSGRNASSGRRELMESSNANLGGGNTEVGLDDPHTQLARIRQGL